MNRRQLRFLLIGGAIAGALDIVFALCFFMARGGTAERLLQIVASGAFGKAALDGGATMAAWGLVLHFVLSFAWTGLFFLVARARPVILRRPYLTALLFGILVFFTMRLVVLPLSAFPFPVKFQALGWGADLLSHMFLFAMPIVWATRKALAA